MDLGLIALIFIAALLGPALSLLTRGAIPVVVGQLIAGVILGKTALRVINPDKSDLTLLYSLGFVMLMFMVGMRVPLHDQRLRSALGPGFVAFAVAVPLSLAAGLGAHAAVGDRRSCMRSSSSLPRRQSRCRSSTRTGWPALDPRGDGLDHARGHPCHDRDPARDQAHPRRPRRARGADRRRAHLGVYLTARWLRHVDLVKRIRAEGNRRNWAIDLRLAVIVLVSLAFVAQEVGASLLVAGFGTGLVVAAIGGPERLSREVLGLGQGFLVPLFFVLLGARLDLRALATSHGAVILALLLAAFAIAVHVIASVVIRAPRAVGLLATGQVGVPSAVIALGLPAHAIDQGQASAIFCAALLSTAACARRGGDPAARERYRGPSVTAERSAAATTKLSAPDHPRAS